MSWFHKLVSCVEIMWKKAPAIEVQLASDVNYMVPFVEELDTLVLPEYAPLINPIIDRVKVGLSALKTTIQQSGTSPSIVTIAASVKTNMTSLLSVAQIKDPATITRIQGIVNLVNGELDAITGSIPPPVPAAAK